MQPNQNSFRLGRLSHTSDFRKHSVSEYTNNPKDTLKLAALTSINRGVKYNDLSFITGRELPKLRKQPEQAIQNLEYSAAHENLATIRKKHDTVNKQKLQTEAKINLLKEEKQKFKIFQGQLLQNKNQGGDKVKSLEDQLNKIKLQYEESEWNKKVFQMMAQRIKHDKVVYDQRKYDLQKELQHLRKQLKIFVKQGTGINEQTDRSSKVYDKLLRQLQSQEFERQAHLQSLSGMLNQKYVVNQSNSVRKNQIEEIALKAMQDKDQGQKNWINILHVNKFVDNLLRNKMNQQMQKFSTVQMAFKNIKIATGVSDAQELIFKFLNKQQVYGELLSKIADNEKLITELRHQQQTLLKKKKTLKEQKQQYTFTKKQEVNLKSEIKEFDEISHKLVSAELNSERIRSWIFKNIKKIQNIQKISEQNTVGRSYSELAESFKKYLQVMSQQVDKCSTELKLQKSISQDQIRPDSKMFRVKAKSKKFNHLGEQFENQFDQEDIPNPNDQQDLILNQRSDILKQNQKFMKDLKKKMQEIKKIRMEAQPKKMATTSPQKKPVAVQE